MTTSLDATAGRRGRGRLRVLRDPALTGSQFFSSTKRDILEDFFPSSTAFRRYLSKILALYSQFSLSVFGANIL